MDEEDKVTAVMPDSRKSLAEINSAAPVDTPGKGLSLAELNKEVNTAESDLALRNSFNPDYTKQAEEAAKDEVIGGFDFNYEYMGGQNYMSDDLHEIQANRQPGWDKTKRGLARFAGEFVLNVLETPGVVGGAIAAAVTQDINKMTDNFWVNATEGMKEAWNDNLPVYSSKKVSEGNLWDKMSSGEFWATEGASAMAFMASALVPGLAVTKAGKAMGILGRLAKNSRYSKALSKIDKLAAKVPGVSDEALRSGRGAATGELSNLITTTFTNTVFEAGVEARGAQDSFNNAMEREYRDGKITLQQLEEYKDESANVAGNTFKANGLILLVPNFVMSKMMLGPTANTLTKAHKNIRFSKAGRWVKGGMEESLKDAPKTMLGKAAQSGVAKALGKTTKGFAKNTFREGLIEEGGQMAAENYFSGEYVEALMTGDDSRNWAKTYMNVLGSTDGQAAILLGGIMAGPMSMRQRYLEGKQLRKNVDNLVNQYNGTVNYYKAAREDFYETDENGDFVLEYRDEKGNLVEEGGKPERKVDATKVAELADAKDRIDKLELARSFALQEGDYNKAIAYSARQQAESFGMFIANGKPGLDALEEMMLTSESTALAVKAINEEQKPEEPVTVESFVAEQMEAAKHQQKAFQFYQTDISKPITTKWERENNIFNGSEESEQLSKYRAQFEDNYAGQYSEASAVERVLDKSAKDVESKINQFKREDKSQTTIDNAEKELEHIKSLLKKAKNARTRLEDPNYMEKRFTNHYNRVKRAKDINDGKLKYDLNPAIVALKEADDFGAIQDVVADLIEKGILLPKVSKDKFPEEFKKLFDATDSESLTLASQLLSVHDEFTEEDEQRIAVRIAKAQEEESYYAMDAAERDETNAAADQRAAEIANAQLEADKAEAARQREEELANRPNEELTLKELRIRYPGVKARSKAVFLTRIPQAETEVFPGEETQEETEELPNDFTIDKLSNIKVTRPDKPVGSSNTFDWLTTATTIDDYFDKLAELVDKVAEGTHTPSDIDHIYMAMSHSPILVDTLTQIAPELANEMVKRGPENSKEAWRAYEENKDATVEELEPEQPKAPKDYDVPAGIVNELVELINAALNNVRGRKLQARIKQLNDILNKKEFAWKDATIGDRLVKEGSKVYWDNSVGTIKSIMKSEDGNGTNMLIQDSEGNLHVVSQAALSEQNPSTSDEVDRLNIRHQDVQDKEKRKMERGADTAVMIQSLGDNHPNASVADRYSPTIEGEVEQNVLNGFLRYLEEARDKSSDIVTFNFPRKLLPSVFDTRPDKPQASEDQKKAADIHDALKAGKPLTEEGIQFMVDFMPITVRVTRGNGAFGAATTRLSTAAGVQSEQFELADKPLREKIIRTWIAAGQEFGAQNQLNGVEANWTFVKTGKVNMDPNMPSTGNRVNRLRDIDINTMQLFVVGSKVSKEIITRNGDRQPVPGDLIGKTGGIYVTVKDNNGRPFPLRLKTNTLADTPELEVIMMLMEELMIGETRMNQGISPRVSELLESEIPLLFKAFDNTPTVGELYNTLVYSGDIESQLGVFIDPQARMLKIGRDTWTGEEFMNNIDTIKALMGLKFKNINFPSNDRNKNKLLSTKDKKYLEYIIETKAIATNVKPDAPIFVGEVKGDTNYSVGLNPYLAPNSVRMVKGQKTSTKDTSKKATDNDKGSINLGSKLMRQFRKAGYDPKTLTTKAAEFLKSVKDTNATLLSQVIEDYNNRIIAEEDNADDHVIKKCKG